MIDKNFKFDSGSIERIVNNISLKIKLPLEKEEFSQLLLDIITRNYKLKKSSYAKLILYSTYILFPTQEVAKYLGFGGIIMLIDKGLSFLDEAFMASQICILLINEIENYRVFIQSEEYKPSSIKDLINIDINISELSKSISENINPSKIKSKLIKEINTTSLVNSQSYLTVEDYVFYEKADYKTLIRNYINTNKLPRNNNFVKVDSNKLKRTSIFNKSFNVVECENIVQNDMNDELESSKDEIGTYRLILNKIVNDQTCNFSFKTISSTNIYNIYNSKFTISIANKIIDEINIESNQKIDNFIFILKDFIIEISFLKNYHVQVLSSKAELIVVAKGIQKELNKKLKSSHHTQTIKIEEKKNKKMNVDNVIDDLICIGIQKIYALNSSENKRSFSHSEFLNFIPMYDKDVKIQYLMALQNKFKDVIVGSKEITVMIDEEYDFSKEYDFISLDIRDEYAMINYVIPGKLDVKHLVKIFHKVFLFQIYAQRRNFLKLIINIDCKNEMFVQIELFKDFEVKIIDASGRLGNEAEIVIEKIIKEELKKNYKMINKYNK